ncbi:MAG TPA: glutathione S-transferase N-terminal domain-containing protein [Patescibacteria group bacterium]|nr:glutathione S-transferase N-terminal domain-containing protein [Patescibacteria group bacterium]
MVDAIPRVYTLPDCPKCEKLKAWLSEKGINYDVKSFDTETQLEFIMKNMFGNPPILELGEAIASSEELFHEDILDVSKVKGMLEIG